MFEINESSQEANGYDYPCYSINRVSSEPHRYGEFICQTESLEWAEIIVESLTLLFKKNEKENI